MPPRSLPADWVTSDGQALLAPTDGTNFVVGIGTDSELDRAWPDFERLKDEDSFDARRANVGVFSDDGPPEAHRERILAALEALPDRGEPVMVVGG